MAKRVIDDNTLTGIAEAIREKAKTTDSLTPLQMPGAILDIKGAEVEEITNGAGGKSVYINSEVPKLPEGYTRLQYIQSTGTQYINTEYTPNSNTRVVLDAYNLSTGSGWTFGVWSSSSSLQYAFSCNASYSFRYGSTGAALSTVPVGPVRVDFNKNAYNLNGTSGTLTAESFTCAYPMYLFAINAAGAVSSGKFTGQVSSCQIYDNGTLVRDYVPCLNASGVAGLHDMVNGVFYGDAAGVGFIAGPVVMDYVLPDGYTRLKYIESTGTQYVNTGFKPNQDTRVVIDLQGATTDSGVYGMHYGVKQFMAGKASKNSWNYYVYYGSQEVVYATRTANDFATRHTIDHNKNVITTGGVTQTLSAETFSSSYNMYLFGVNNDGSLGWAGKIRVFACQIYDNGTLVRDYVPCLNESNVAGLYDFVNGVFYGDAAGGTFVAGPVVLEYELPEGYTPVEYIQTNGDNWIDTGIYPSGTTRVVADTDLIGGDTYPTLFGAWTDGNSGKYIFLALSNTTIRSYYGTTETDATVSIYGRHTVEQNKGNAYVDGVQYVSKADSSFTTSQTLYLGTFHGSETSGSFGAVAKYYSAQIYQGSTIVRNFVPCTNASGVGGMYDTVNGVFYTAGGSGAFELGAVVMPGVSKVVLEDQVLIDLTSDTVTPEALLSGFTAHNAMGQLIQGAASAGRGFATGAFTPTGNVTSMTISGLSFTPTKVVLTTTKEQTWIDYSKSCFYWAVYDPENSVSLLWRSYLDSDYGMMMISTYPASSLNVAVSNGGFTVSSFSYGTYLYFPGNTTYRWYAIG